MFDFSSNVTKCNVTFIRSNQRQFKKNRYLGKCSRFNLLRMQWFSLRLKRTLSAASENKVLCITMGLCNFWCYISLKKHQAKKRGEVSC